MEIDDILGFVLVLGVGYFAWSLLRGKQVSASTILYDAQHNIDPSTGSPIVIDTTDPGLFQFAPVPTWTMPPIENLPTTPVGS